MAKYLTNNQGTLTERAGRTTSAGAADAGELPQLDASGRLDNSFMPTGIGADTAAIQASEALAAGDVVNVHDVSSAARVRKADASSAGKHGHGYVTSATASGSVATVYFEGTNAGQTSVPPGPLFLATTPGKVTATAPSGAGVVVQRIGFGTSATTFNFQAGEPVVLVA